MRSAILLLLLAATTAAGDLDDLLGRLRSDAYQTRRQAVLACEDRPEPAVLDRLLEMAREDPHPNIRAAAAGVLATFRDGRVFPCLAATAREETWPGPRRAALVALGRLGDDRALPILLDALDPPTDQDAGYAAEGLGLLGKAEAFEPIANALVEAGENPYVAHAAPEALVRIDRERGIALLLERFAKLPGGARLAAAEVIAAEGTPAASPALLPHLGALKTDLRRAAIRALGGTGGEAAREALAAQLEKHPEDTAAAARALREIGDAAASPALAATLGRTEDPAARIAILEALGRLGDRRAVASIVPLLDDATRADQPPTMSAIAPFPLNTLVRDAAWWAIRTLRDGRPPVEVADLSAFRGPPAARATIDADLPALRRWWDERRGEEAWRFP